MSIQKYEAFLKTVELGSITKAAETLGYTQSGISHIINALEKEWDLTLLNRDRSGICITSEGLKLLPMMRNICKAHRDMMDEIKNLHGLQSGLIRIGTFTSVSVHWLPDIIKTFQNKYPNIEFELLHGNYNEIEHWITEGMADCGFLKMPVNAKLECIFLKQDRYMVILPENHELSKQDSIPMDSLLKEPFILIKEGAENPITEIFELNQLYPNVKYTVKDDYAIISMVESGLGISILPELVLHRTPYKIVKKELSTPTYRRLGIALNDIRYASPATKQFLKHLQDWIA